MFFKSEGEGHNSMKYPFVIEVPWKVVIDSEKIATSETRMKKTLNLMVDVVLDQIRSSKERRLCPEIKLDDFTLNYKTNYT